MKRKVFAYVTMQEDHSTYLLVFESLDEPGFEVPKGSIEPGEDLATAVHREVHEESGVVDLEIIQELGKTLWQDEEQHFFYVRTKTATRDEFEHQVTGGDFDHGFQYQYTWLPIDAGLATHLVQGCGRFLDELITAVSEVP
jgi:8-oxo-dGTP pyrophosphatase MutT (NUDIX family)